MTLDEITFVRAATGNFHVKGVHCAKCKFRMLPSATKFFGEKMYYCMPCRFAVGETTGIIVSLLALVRNDRT